MPDPLEQVVKRTIISERREDVSRGVAVVMWMASAQGVVAPWWSHYRDRQLRAFWKSVDPLAGAVYALVSRMATIPFHIEPTDYTIAAYLEQASRFETMLLQNAEFGKGWEVFISKWVEDLLTQDNGAFAEIVGDGDPNGPIVGMPYSVSHLDASRCDRTSNPEYPVIYNDKATGKHRLHYTRCAFASLQPSPIVDMNDVGFCAISKCLLVSQGILDALVYKGEKLGSRPTRSILIGQGGLDADVIRDAFAIASETMDNRNLSRFSQAVVMGDTAHPQADLKMVDLASVPDGFDWTQDMTIAMATIALAFGVDARELFPMIGEGSTRADALIQHLKARVKGIGHLLQTIEQTFGPKILPPSLSWEFDYTDDAQDRQAAEIKKIRSEYHQIDLTLTGSVDERTVREQMVADGDITQQQFERLEMKDGRLSDGTSILQLFYDPDYKAMLKMPVPDPLDTEGNDPEAMKAVIRTKGEELLKALGIVTNYRQREMIETAWYAIDFLRQQYESVKMAKISAMAETEPAVEGEEMPEDETVPNENNEEVSEDEVDLNVDEE